MEGEVNLNAIVANLNPVLNEGQYVYSHIESMTDVSLDKILFFFREKEKITIVMKREDADVLELTYQHVMAWITLKVHSSLAAVGLTAAFSNALGNAGISCNVVAAYFHDHIFVDEKDALRAMEVLNELKNRNKR